MPSSSTTRGTSRTTATSTTLPAMGTGGDALYGDYTRPEFGLIKKPALRHHSDEWSIVFPEPGAWKGVVVIVYWGLRRPLGHAYAYQATEGGSLRLGSETRAPSRVAADGLERGGFTCPRGMALYAWSRSPNYAYLRLRPIRDSCSPRRRILTADWTFID